MFAYRNPAQVDGMLSVLSLGGLLDEGHLWPTNLESIHGMRKEDHEWVYMYNIFRNTIFFNRAKSYIC